MDNVKSVCVTGGAGYVGSALVPGLLADGYKVTVLDLYLYGREALAACRGNPALTEVAGDIRDTALLRRVLPGHDAVIHLACISNDPSYELNPALGKSINYDAFPPLIDASKAAGVKRFLYASSSSVYGIKDEAEVTEDLPLAPLTDYSRYKALCEDYLHAAGGEGFTVTTLRPSTVCGYAPRLRLDLTVNILTSHALGKGVITVFGGEQKRPNLHIDDMVDVYRRLLKEPARRIHDKIYNVGYQNYKVREIAEIVRRTLGGDIAVTVTPTNDNRSYHVNADKIRRELGYAPTRTLEDAVLGLQRAFVGGLIPDPDDIKYSNIKTMRHANLA